MSTVVEAGGAAEPLATGATGATGAAEALEAAEADAEGAVAVGATPAEALALALAAVAGFPPVVGLPPAGGAATAPIVTARGSAKATMVVSRRRIEESPFESHAARGALTRYRASRALDGSASNGA
jgi:hypothetical protein